jgi:hypothetical protein
MAGCATRAVDHAQFKVVDRAAQLSQQLHSYRPAGAFRRIHRHIGLFERLIDGDAATLG